MNLIRPIPPAEYVYALRRGLAEFVDPGDTAAAQLLQNHEAYEVYSLNLDEFLQKKGDLNQAATPVGWRFLTADPMCDLVCHVGGSAPRKIVAVARTPDVHIAFHRVRQLEDLIHKPPTDEWKKVVEQPEFELRGLRIPSLLIEAVWLRSCKKDGRDAANDFLIPCMGFTHSKGVAKDTGRLQRVEWGWELVLLRPYGPKEFLKEISESVKVRLDRQKALYSKLAAVVPLPPRSKPRKAAPPAPKPRKAAAQALPYALAPNKGNPGIQPPRTQ